MKKKIAIFNGPNLNLLGTREPDKYGSKTLSQVLSELTALFPELELYHFQSNHEGELIDKIHEIGFTYDGGIINAGGLTHTSVALADAISSVTTPFVEVHISNIHARERFRHHSYLSRVCLGMVCGLGTRGYELAIRYFL